MAARDPKPARLDWKEPVAIWALPTLCGALWFAARDFGHPFAHLFVLAMAAEGFLLGWSVRGWSR